MGSSDADHPTEIPLQERLELSGLTTFARNKRLPIHRWFPYLQGFSRDLVDLMMRELNTGNQSRILDPFCGCGTTILTSAQRGMPSVGVDVFPLATFVTKVKLQRGYKMHELSAEIDRTSRVKPDSASAELAAQMVEEFPFMEKAFSKRNLSELLAIREAVVGGKSDLTTKNFLMLGLAGIMEAVGFYKRDGAHYKYIDNKVTPRVSEAYLQKTKSMYSDLSISTLESLPQEAHAEVYEDDARKISKVDSGSVDRVITSPPYLNRDSYVGQNKFEATMLDLLKSYEDYRRMTFDTFRSHVEAKKKFETDLHIPKLERSIDAVKQRALSNPKVPEMLYGYFEDMHLSLKEIYRVMKESGKVAMVVGNVSWSGVIFEVDQLLAEIAGMVGFKPEKIWVTRYKSNSVQQALKYGRTRLRESIVFLER